MQSPSRYCEKPRLLTPGVSMDQPQANSFVSAMLGALLSIPYIAAMGMLAMQVDAGRLGLSVDLLNRPTGVQDPGSSWPSLIGLAVVSLLVLRVVTRGRVAWGGRGRAAFGFGFSGVLLAVTIYAVFVTGPNFLTGLQRFEMVEGPHSWIDRAGNSTSLQLVLAIVIAWSLSQWRKGTSIPSTSTNALPFAGPSTSVDPSTS